ncbi:MAG: hypothetical protein CMJ52_03320 [Planctomycetaceae bacterium]|nr:hypothetical protein [Planctomycetaceae bacterium]
MSSRRRIVLFGIALAVGGVTASLTSCSSPIPNRDPTGDAFPPVRGESLEGRQVELPAAVSGEPAILMVGYLQRTQFDLDRWTLGFVQAEADIRVIEVPAIVGWFPSTFLRGTIDDGMRAGIPAEDWNAVVTLYGDDAERVQALTGTEDGGNGRILLLDERGRIRWFWDQGYSPKRLLELLEVANGLRTAGTAPSPTSPTAPGDS